MKLEPKDFELICTLVGQIIVPFAILEASLNGIVEASYNGLGGNSLDKELPRSLSKSKAFLEKCIRRLPVLLPLKDSLQKLLNDTASEALIRNGVAHGYVSDFNPEKTQITFRQLEAYTDKQTHTQKINHYSIDELIACGGRIQHLSITMNLMAYSFLKLRVGQY